LGGLLLSTARKVLYTATTSASATSTAGPTSTIVSSKVDPDDPIGCPSERLYKMKIGLYHLDPAFNLSRIKYHDCKVYKNTHYHLREKTVTYSSASSEENRWMNTNKAFNELITSSGHFQKAGQVFL
jgi:hypothetical protein